MKIQNIISSVSSAVIILLTTLSAYGQESDSLNHYLQAAIQNNEGIKADYYSYEAALNKIPQAGSWSDPTLESGFYLSPMELVGGKEIANFSLMQMFSWPGTRKAAQTEMGHMANMEFEKYRESVNQLYFDVYDQWFKLNTLQQRLTNYNDNKELLKILEELALLKYSSSGGPSSYPASSARPSTSSAPVSSGGVMSGMGGVSASTVQSSSSSGMSGMSGSSSSSMGSMNSSSGGMSDVLRIKLEIAELNSNIETILSEINTEKAKFNALLNRPIESEVVLPDSFGKIPFQFDMKSSMEKIASFNPMLGMIKEEELAFKAKGEMDKKMSYPMFGVGLEYMLIGKSSSSTMDPMSSMAAAAGTSSMSGMDMVMPMVSITIPLYRGKYKAQQRESKNRQQAAVSRFTDTYKQLEAELVRSNHYLDDADRKIRLYEEQTKLATTTYDLIVQEYASGKSDLSNVIQVQRQLLDYSLKEVESIASYNTMVAAIQKILSFTDKK
ncbi:MAG: TolC family protein [Dysgonamonadaceae bacterium]